MPHIAGSLDANVLLRLLLNDIPTRHQAAKRLLEQTPGQFAVADIAIVEVVFVLQRAYEFSREHVAEAIEGLMQLAQINCNRTLLEEAMSLYAEHPALSFEDCCLAVYAKLDNAEPLWTFDKKLAGQTPAQLLDVSS